MATVTNSDTANPAEATGLSRHFAVAIASWARPDDAAAYTALDVISDSSTVAAALQFPNTGKGGAIIGATIVIGENKAVVPRLYLFDTEPTNQLDNGAFALVAADAPKLIDYFDFVDADKLLIGAAQYLHIPTRARALGEFLQGPIPYASADGHLYGLLQTVDGYSPGSGGIEFTIRLQLEVNG